MTSSLLQIELLSGKAGSSGGGGGSNGATGAPLDVEPQDGATKTGSRSIKEMWRKAFRRVKTKDGRGRMTSDVGSDSGSLSAASSPGERPADVTYDRTASQKRTVSAQRLRNAEINVVT